MSGVGVYYPHLVSYKLRNVVRCRLHDRLQGAETWRIFRYVLESMATQGCQFKAGKYLAAQVTHAFTHLIQIVIRTTSRAPRSRGQTFSGEVWDQNHPEQTEDLSSRMASGNTISDDYVLRCSKVR